jgi:hypothetical protein
MKQYKKDAYYFPHFSNARNDSKIVKLRRIYGPEGYGIFFMLLEVLREQTEFKLPLNSIEDLSYEWHTSKEKVLSIINDFDLFNISDNQFFSPKLVFYLQPYLEKSKRARSAALKRWNNANAYTNAMLPDNKCNASKIKETKIKETKKEKTVNVNINGNTRFDFVSIDYTNLHQYILKCVSWEFSKSDFLSNWEQFTLECQAKDDIYRTKGSYYKHFLNWLKTERMKKTNGKKARYNYK